MQEVFTYKNLPIFIKLLNRCRFLPLMGKKFVMLMLVFMIVFLLVGCEEELVTKETMDDSSEVDYTGTVKETTSVKVIETEEEKEEIIAPEPIEEKKEEPKKSTPKGSDSDAIKEFFKHKNVDFVVGGEAAIYETQVITNFISELTADGRLQQKKGGYAPKIDFEIDVDSANKNTVVFGNACSNELTMDVLDLTKSTCGNLVDGNEVYYEVVQKEDINFLVISAETKIGLAQAANDVVDKA